jgi:hypothetical protein
MSIAPSAAVVVTTTYYPDPADPVQQVRAELASDAISNLRIKGFPVVVVDGGTHPDLIDVRDLMEAGATVEVGHSRDMVVTRQQAVRTALLTEPSAEFVVWMEPEKDLAFLLSEWIDRMIRERASVLVPMRRSVASYPLFMQQHERRANEAISGLFGCDMGDHLFGPRIFSTQAARRHWLRPYEELGSDIRLWGSIMGPVLSALASGERVVGLPVEFTYPESQRDAETDNPSMNAKRVLQHETIVQLFTDIRRHLDWKPGWQLDLLDSFRLDSQAMSMVDIRDSATAVDDGTTKRSTTN